MTIINPKEFKEALDDSGLSKLTLAHLCEGADELWSVLRSTEEQQGEGYESATRVSQVIEALLKADTLEDFNLELFQEAIERKIDAIAFVYDEYERAIEHKKQLAERFKTIVEAFEKDAKVLENEQSAIKQTLLRLHEKDFIPAKLTGKQRSFSIQNSKPKVISLVNPSELPNDWTIQKVEYKLNKDAILAAPEEMRKDLIEIQQSSYVRFYHKRKLKD